MARRVSSVSFKCISGCLIYIIWSITGCAINPRTIRVLTYYSSLWIVLGAFELATVLDCFTYISLPVLATVCDALPLSTAALVVWRVSVALAGDVAVGYLL